MNKCLLAVIDMWTALFETREHFYSEFAHEYWIWLQERHDPQDFVVWRGCANITLIFDEDHDLPPVDSPMRKPVEWLINRYNVCVDGQPFTVK